MLAAQDHWDVGHPNYLDKDVFVDDNWKADINRDGKVNITDLITVRNNMGDKCK